MARPSTFTRELADTICEGITDGKSLRSLLREDESLPASSTVFRWLADSPEFSEQYAHAREAQADALFDDILEIADEEATMVRKSKHSVDADADELIEVVFDPTAVARNKLRVDARKWMASKLRPKKYGDRLEIDQRTTLTDLTDEQLDAKLAKLAAANPIAG